MYVVSLSTTEQTSVHNVKHENRNLPSKYMQMVLPQTNLTLISVLCLLFKEYYNVHVDLVLLPITNSWYM